MKAYFSVLIIVIISLSFVQCAKKGTPTGGRIDSLPPKFIRAVPENYSVNFDAEEIRIFFNEFIKLDKPQQQIIISPPMDPKPDITPLGFPSRDIKIKINDTLQENTTYVINFGTSIVDNNENNPLPFFKYVFSTGSYIDSLVVRGSIDDAILKEADPFISVMLYEIDENYNDSLVFTQPPRYITNTLDSLRTFELTNLKPGNYQLIALQDLNNDYKYNPGREKIAFLEEPISIPTDSTYNLNLFRENFNLSAERPKQIAQQKLLIGYRGKPDFDSITFTPVSPVPEDFEYRITKVADKDSINFWYKPMLEADSLILAVSGKGYQDTLTTRITEMTLDSLVVTLEPSGTLEFGKELLFKGSTPISENNDELIQIINRDSVSVPFTSELNPFTNTLQINFEEKENENYQITALPGALTDFFGATNDTIKKSLKTRAFSDYGILRLNIQNLNEFPVLVQLTDEKGVVKYEQFSTSESSINFNQVTPGKYLIRIIKDRNANRMWDTGNFLQKIAPEEIIYYPDPVDVRANWDMPFTFTLR